VFSDLVDYKPAIMENKPIIWYNLTQPLTGGLAAPIQRLLESL